MKSIDKILNDAVLDIDSLSDLPYLEYEVVQTAFHRLNIVSNTDKNKFLEVVREAGGMGDADATGATPAVRTDNAMDLEADGDANNEDLDVRLKKVDGTWVNLFDAIQGNDMNNNQISTALRHFERLESTKLTPGPVPNEWINATMFAQRQDTRFVGNYAFFYAKSMRTDISYTYRPEIDHHLPVKKDIGKSNYIIGRLNMLFVH